LTYGFYAAATIDREDFGLKWNMVLADGGFVVGRYARLTINAEADSPC
jgi:polyisoprenoid-binding protein YceI